MSNMDRFVFILFYLSTLTGLTITKPLNFCQSEHYSWRYENQCFEVVFVEKNWYDARNYCARRGGDLVEIRNKGIQSSVVQHLKQNNNGKNGFWIGVTYFDREDRWTWLHEPRAMSYNNWRHDQGSFNHGFLFRYIEECGMIRSDDQYRWHDGPCNGGPAFHYSFICQYDMYPRAHSRHGSTRHTVQSSATPSRESTFLMSSTITPNFTSTSATFPISSSESSMITTTSMQQSKLTDTNMSPSSTHQKGETTTSTISTKSTDQYGLPESQKTRDSSERTTAHNRPSTHTNSASKGKSRDASTLPQIVIFGK